MDNQQHLAAVQQDGLALRYVKEQTPEICLAAVKQNGLALRYVKEHMQSRKRLPQSPASSVG